MVRDAHVAGQMSREAHEDHHRRLERFQRGFLALLSLSWGGCLIEDSLIYYPEAEMDISPADYALPYEELMLRTEDGVTIHAWTIRPDVRKPIIIFFHGNAGNISHRVDRAAWLLKEIEASIMLVEYRGFGRSEGKPSESGLYRDARAAYEWALADGRQASSIVAAGESLGCAMAIELALKREVGAVLLEAPFLSIPDMARQIIPLPVGFLLRTKYENKSKIGKLKAPLFIAHGDRDDVVPFSHGQSLYDLARDPKTFYRISGAHHNDTYPVGGAPYRRAIAAFLENAIRP